MIQLFASLGAIIAGLAMLVTQGLPLLKASRTGILISKAYGAPKIVRQEEPERFRKLFSERRTALILPLVLVGVGLVFFLQFVLYVIMVAERG